MALVGETHGPVHGGNPRVALDFSKAVVGLSEVHASYSEVKLSQEELVQMVATAVTGMKYSSEAERLRGAVGQVEGSPGWHGPAGRVRRCRRPSRWRSSTQTRRGSARPS